MRQTETDIFYTHEFVNEFSINSMCVGTQKMPTFETGRFIRSNLKFQTKKLSKIYIWSFNKHEMRTRIFLYTYTMTKFV